METHEEDKAGKLLQDLEGLEVAELDDRDSAGRREDLQGNCNCGCGEAGQEGNLNCGC